MMAEHLAIALNQSLTDTVCALQDWHYLTQLFTDYGLTCELDSAATGLSCNAPSTNGVQLIIEDQQITETEVVYRGRTASISDVELKISDFWPDRQFALSRFDPAISARCRGYSHIVLDFSPANLSQLLTAFSSLLSQVNETLQLSFPASTTFVDELQEQLTALGMSHRLVIHPLSEHDWRAYLHAADLLITHSPTSSHYSRFAKVWCIPVLNFDTSGQFDYLPFLLAGPRRVRYLSKQRADWIDQNRQQIQAAIEKFALTLNLVLAPVAAKAELDWQIEGPFDSNYSLSIVNRETARALAQAGQTVRMRSLDNAQDFAPADSFLQEQPDYARFYQRYLSAAAAPHCSLRFAYPPHSDDQHGVIRGMHTYAWEESGYPAQYVQEFNRKLDGISVMTEFVATILRQHGVRCPIKVSGTNLEHFQSIEAQVPVIADLREFCFLHISSGFARKGIDVLLAAYGQAFTIHDPVSLIIKSFPGPLNETKKWLKHFRAVYPEFPHVIDLECDLTAAEIAGLYQISHAFVAPCRAEGFGLPMAEAMLRKVPVITTAWGGQTDFCTQQTAWLIDFQFNHAQTHLGIADSVWAEPDVQHLSLLMRELRNAPATRIEEKTHAALQLVSQRYTRKVVQEKLLELFNPDFLSRERIKLEHLVLITPWHAYDETSAISQQLFAPLSDLKLDIFTKTRHTAQMLPVLANQHLHGVFNNSASGLSVCLPQLRQLAAPIWIIHYDIELLDGKSLLAILQLAKQLQKACYLIVSSTLALEKLLKHQATPELIAELLQLPGILVFNLAALNLCKQVGLKQNLLLMPLGAPAFHKPQPCQTPALKLASLGELNAESGCVELIHAFASLLQSQPEAELYLYNYKSPGLDSSVCLNHCLELMQTYQLQGKLHFCIEYFDDAELQEKLATTDIILFNQQQAGNLPQRAITLALASGKLTAMTQFAGFDDYRRYCHLLPAGDVDALSRALLQLIIDPTVKSATILDWQKARHWNDLAQRFVNMLEGRLNYPEFH